MSRQTLYLIIGGAALYLILGWFTLTSGSIGVKGQTGIVWNQIQTGGEKLARLESQYAAGGIKLPNDIAAKVVEGRVAFANAQKTGDLEGAIAAAGQIRISLQALSEASVILNTTPALMSLMDETSEAFNKIGYQRDILIEKQTSYAFARAIFFPLAGMFPDYGILGSNADPARPMPTSQFAPTQAR